jgi:hypothetical protein
MMISRISRIASIAFMGGLMAISAAAAPPLVTDDPNEDGNRLSHDGRLIRPDPNAALEAHDAAVSGIISSAPFAKVTKNLAPSARGVRLEADATTDVWVLGNYAYTGTFNDPCGGEENAGIFVWDVHNPNKVSKAGFIPSPAGSRANDVKAAAMNSGDILVHTNESCAGGPGGFEIFDVSDPTNPVFLSHVQVNEINPISDALFGGLQDNGVHNLWLFKQGAKDYVAAQSEGAFDGFQIFDITDPVNPVLVSGWGAEEIFDPGVGNETVDVSRVLDAAIWLLGGVGASQNRFLHDFTISKDGTRAYLAHWDAGLILLDISNPASPQFISVALDPVNGSLDGEVNSHSVWPSEDGKIVVEGEEDFSAWESSVAPSNLTFGDSPANTIPGTAISTTAGDAFEANQTSNDGTVNGSSLAIYSGPLSGQSYVAVELGGNQPRFADSGPKTGNVIWIGRACNGDALVNPLALGDIAVVRRGACTFAEKLANAAVNGAAAVVISNNNPTSTPWSGLRIWDYSDPVNPVLASIFDTECSASTAPGGNCDPRGTYSSHNVVVQTSGNKVKAYVSWYSDGVVVVDVSDPYNPVETARYHRAGADFEAENGGIQDIWGIYKVENSPWIYASDRNGGLIVLKEYGAGSAKNGKE